LINGTLGLQHLWMPVTQRQLSLFFFFEWLWLHSGYVKITIENGPVEIVDLSIKNGDFPMKNGDFP